LRQRNAEEINVNRNVVYTINASDPLIPAARIAICMRRPESGASAFIHLTVNDQTTMSSAATGNSMARNNRFAGGYRPVALIDVHPSM
jgi:hypothetical protein